MFGGVRLTVTVRDAPRLWALAALTAVFVVNFFLEDVVPALLWRAVPVVYGVVTILVGFVWFLRIRPGRGS